MIAVRVSRFLVGCHPRRWRERYGEEVLDVLAQHRPTARTVLNVGVSAASAHLDPAWRGRRRADGGPRWFQTPFGVGVATFGVLLIFVSGCWGLGAWKDYEGNNGLPMPLSGGAFGMVFSPDGRTVAAINPNLEIWSVADPAHPIRLGYSRGDTAGAPAAFSPDGRLLATSGWPGLLWNVAHPTPRPVQLGFLPNYPGVVNALLFFPDGRTLVSADGQGTMTLWNTADSAHPTHLATIPATGTGATTGTSAGASHPGVSALAFSPDGRVLASGTDSGDVTFWNAADPAHLTRIATLSGTTQAGGVSALAFSPDGHMLASASDDGIVILRDVTNPAAPVMTAVFRLSIPSVRVDLDQLPSNVELAFAADGRTLTTIAGNTAVTLWNVTDPMAVTRITTLTSNNLGTGAVAFGPGGRIVAGAPTVGDTLALWPLP